jgi:hypothetical protein
MRAIATKTIASRKMIDTIIESIDSIGSAGIGS